MCPHAVQVELATDRMGILGKRKGVITSEDVITDWSVARTALEGLRQRRGVGGSSPCWGKGRQERLEGKYIQQMSRSFDVTLS